MNEDTFFTEERAERRAMEDVDYEALSYGKKEYKRVCRLRKKARERGIEVPRLHYELTKPEKPRLAFWVIAVVSAVIFAGIIVGLFFLYSEMIKFFSDGELDGLSDFIGVLFQPEVLSGSLRLSALPGVLMVAVYLLIFVLFLLPFVAAIYFYRFVRDAFYMAKCSKEEFAKGNVIASRLIGLIAVLATVVVLFILTLLYVEAAGARTAVSLIFAGIVITLGGLIGLIFYEKYRCGKWFDSFDEEKKQNYLEHERALRSVKRRLKSEKQFWSNLGK